MNDDDNKANGYYERSLNTGSFKLNIMSQEIERINLDHKYYLKPYKTVNEDYIDLLMSLVSNGYFRKQDRFYIKKLRFKLL